MIWVRTIRLVAALALLAGPAASAPAKTQPDPWMDHRLTPEARADLLVRQMSLDEQIALVHGHFPLLMKNRPAEVVLSAGYVPGNARLSIPALRESDASLGVAAAGRKDDQATALPSGQALAATWDEGLARQAGAMIGKQARQKGFNVLLAGGVNLARDPRNGRNFEYLGEDPLLAGRLGGAAIAGVQSQHVVSTVKHFAANDQETGRMVASVELDEAAMRESDLLAFQIAIERGHPGSVMCAYNRIGGTYACEHPGLLTQVLKGDWGYRGWVMSDWGAVHTVGAANAGLDQESGQQLDRQPFFDAPLKAAVQAGTVSEDRLRDMVRRILTGMFAAGLFDHRDPGGALDTVADGAVAQRTAEQGIVLLKNDAGLLPLAAGARRIAVIGGKADLGVLSGGGSSQVIPRGSTRFDPPKGAPPWSAGVIYHPSSPLAAIRARAGGAQVTWDPGTEPGAAAAAARNADVAIVFATSWASEEMDVGLTLPGDQDATIAAAAAANPRTIVVLQTGGPAKVARLDLVGALLQAWYPGSRGGEAIAAVLFGDVNPSGRLPMTWPTGEAQLPNPALPGADQGKGPKTFPIRYPEGADVGYRWFTAKGLKPLYPFGRGLSYTAFRYSDLKVTGGKAVAASFTVTNTGARAGTDTPQLYLAAGPARAQQRLVGWSRVALKPGKSKRVNVEVDPRMLANWDVAAHGWTVDPGAYRLFVGPDAATAVLNGWANVAGAKLRP